MAAQKLYRQNEVVDVHFLRCCEVASQDDEKSRVTCDDAELLTRSTTATFISQNARFAVQPPTYNNI